MEEKKRIRQEFVGGKFVSLCFGLSIEINSCFGGKAFFETEALGPVEQEGRIIGEAYVCLCTVVVEYWRRACYTIPYFQKPDSEPFC